MSSTMASTGASIDTVTGFSSRVRRLQRLELAGQQARRHEMTFSRGEPARDQFLRAVEKDDADILASMHEDVAIGALQRGAGDHGVLAGLADPVDLGGDGLQPGPAILVGQRLAGAHLGDVAGGVKPVAILVSPAQPFGQRFARSCSCPSRTRPSRSARRASVACHRHENSPAARPGRPARWSRRWSARGSPAGSRRRARASRSRACPAPADLEQHFAAGGERGQGQGDPRHEGLDMRLGTPTTQRSVSSSAG